MSPSPSLLSLPPRVLERIVWFALGVAPELQSVLVGVDARLARATFAARVHAVRLADDDELLVHAEDTATAPRTPLAAVWRRAHLAAAVAELVVAPASAPASATPLEDVSFLLLVLKLSALTAFTWAAQRLPPPSLCPALGTAATALGSFTLTLSATLDRWDAPNLAQLPPTVTRLDLAQLSLDGVRALATAAAALPLEHVKLSRTLFVDDALLDALADQGRLKSLRILQMHGTKLTDRGLVSLFERCDALDTLELSDVEGTFPRRLSKACWTAVAPYAQSLTRLTIAFAEAGPHKSWAADHLASLPPLIAVPSLLSLAITRLVPPGALVPGRHSTSHFPISDVAVPRAMPDNVLDAIVEKGPAWRSLELDFWKLTEVETNLKRVLDKTTGLEALSVLLDCPFKSLLLLNSSFAISHDLRSLTVSIDPRHTPELASLSYTAFPPTPASSPMTRSATLPDASFQPFTPTTPASPPLSHRSLSSSSPSSPILESASLPAAKEWRRFLKKQHRLTAVIWTGRGGLGSWRFDRSSSIVKVDFAPVSSSLPVPPSLASPAGPRARRMSSVSLKGSCLEKLDLSPPSPIGLGLGLGPIHDEPSPSHAPKTKLSRANSSGATATSPLEPSKFGPPLSSPRSPKSPLPSLTKPVSIAPHPSPSIIGPLARSPWNKISPPPLSSSQPVDNKPPALAPAPSTPTHPIQKPHIRGGRAVKAKAAAAAAESDAIKAAEAKRRSVPVLERRTVPGAAPESVVTPGSSRSSRRRSAIAGAGGGGPAAPRK